MKDIAIRVGGTIAEICADNSNNPSSGSNVVKLRPRRNRADAAVPEQPPVCGSFESTQMIWLQTPQRLPAAALTVAFATSGRALVAHAGASYLWFDIAWDADRLLASGPVERTDEPSTPLLSIALLWFERFLLRGPRLAVDDEGFTLSGLMGEITFTAAHESSGWCVVPPARLQC